MQETDLYRLTKNWLHLAGYTVYSEVKFLGSSRVIDLVGLDEVSQKSISIELKLRVNAKLKEQVRFNSAYFDKSLAALPFDANIKNLHCTVLLVNPLLLTVEEIVKDQEASSFKPSFSELKKRLYLNRQQLNLTAGMPNNADSLTARRMVLEEVCLILLKWPQGLIAEDILANLSSTPWQDPVSSLNQALKQDNRFTKSASLWKLA